MAGVPPIQQFPIKSADGTLVASGCVPTAGASLIAFWAARPTTAAWGGEGEQALVRRLRSRLRMGVIPDAEGYTDGKMSLAGAFPEQLAEALQADADERGVDVDVAISGYDRRLLSAELSAGRPVLVSCMVLVPRKPQLSWGHQVVAVGRAEIGGLHLHLAIRQCIRHCPWSHPLERIHRWRLGGFRIVVAGGAGTVVDALAGRIDVSAAHLLAQRERTGEEQQCCKTAFYCFHDGFPLNGEPI